MSVLFTTEDLIVRRFEARDAAECLTWLADPDVMRYIEEPFDAEKCETFLRTNALIEEPRVHAVERKTDNRLIGHLIFHPFNDDDYELGWILRRDAWHHGYADQLTKGVIRLAEEKGIDSLIIECDKEQKASIAIAEKNGFVRIGNDSDLLQYQRKRK